MVRPSERRRVTLVTASWGDGDEGRYALRQIAGALATAAQVTVVHVLPEVDGPEVVRDGAFEVRRVAGAPAEPITQEAVLAAVGGAEPGRPLPAMLARALLEMEGGWSEAVLPAVEATAPDVVVLGGIQQAWPPAALAELRVRPWRRVVVPLAGDDAKLELAGYRDLLGTADVIATVTRGEQRRVEGALAALGAGDAADGLGPSIVALDVPVRVNPAAKRQRLVGLTNFDDYLLLLRGFPPGTPERLVAPDFERMRALVPSLDVADVTEAGWRVTHGERSELVRVGHSRVNLWRLMSHALVTVDLRPGGIFGREAIESMWLGTPVLVPSGHPAAEAVAEAGGGLVLEDEADLPEVVASLAPPSGSGAAGDGGRQALSERGAAWAQQHHADQQGFVQAVVQGLLG